MTEDHVDRIQAQWRRERPDLDLRAQRVIGRLHRLANDLTERLVAVYAEFGLSEAEFDLLATLRRLGAPFEAQPSGLAQSTMVTTGGLTKRLDRLEARGLVRRLDVSGGDGRSKRVRLTAKGLRLIDEAVTAHMANEKDLISPLSAGQAKELEALLRSWQQGLPDTEND